MEGNNRHKTNLPAVFWKRLWLFTVLATATIVLSMPAVGENDWSQPAGFVGAQQNRAAKQLSLPSQSAGFAILDQFDSHSWADVGVGNSRPGTYQYSPNRATQGSQALKITAPIQPLFEDNPVQNRVAMSVSRNLPLAEDWSNVHFVTLDAYLEESPADFPELELTLSNSAGLTYTAQTIGNYSLKQWENPNLIFPIQGTGAVEDAPAEILTDVRRIEIAIVGYNEPIFQSEAELEEGNALTNLNIHLDNFKLNGSQLWDSFEGPDFGWIPAGDVSTAVGITHNQTWNNSAGALYFGWQYGGSNPEASVATTQFASPVDWSSYNYIQAQMWVSNSDIPFTVRLTDRSGNRAVTAPSNSTVSQAWGSVTWAIPRQSNLDFNNIFQLEILVEDLTIWQEGESYIDELMLVRDAGQPYNVKTRVLAGKNEIEWVNPGKAEIGSVAVYGDTAGFPLSVGSGTQICQVSAASPMGSCVHEGVLPDESWFYSVFPLQEGAVLATSEMGQQGADRNLLLVRPEGSQIEIAISPENGAITYVQDTVTGKSHSTGSLADALWKIDFLDESTLPSLSAADFSADSETAAFSFTPEPPTLNYLWNENGQSLTMQVRILPDGPNSFQLKASITNQTGVPIRTVSLPHQLGFTQTGLTHALYPLGEGVTLKPKFFAEQRAVSDERPGLFADLLAVESDSGDLAITMVQDSLYQADLIPNHNLANPVFQPNRLGYGSTRTDGFMQIDMLTHIPSGQTWESGTLRLSINQNFSDIARQYAADNGIDQNPTLAEKLAPWGTYDTLAQSPIYFLDASKSIALEKAGSGLLWQSVADEWLPSLGSPGLIQFYHWQESEDPNGGLPSSQPIWTDRYGPEVDLFSLTETLEENGFMSMPTTNWTVWNDPTLLATVPASATLNNLRGIGFPYTSGADGLLMTPWRQETQFANDATLETYSNTIPQAFMFLADGAGQGVRYTTLGDGSTGSASAYTTAALAETGRLADQLPVFTDAAVDQLAASVTGFNQSIHGDRLAGNLLHMGDLFDSYSTYPLAAEMVHTQVAFYPHVTGTNSWGAEDRAVFSHYMLFGYNQTGDLSRHYGETDWLNTLAAYQKAVGQRTFGQPLVSHEFLTNDQTVVETVWGTGNEQISIAANFDPDGVRKSYERSDGYTLASNGFHATSLDGDMTAGIYTGTFNGSPLAAGDHWLVVEREPRKISVKQLDGGSTPLAINRPRSWRDPAKISLLQIMSNGSARISTPDDMTAEQILFTYNQNLSVLNTTEYLLFYGDFEQMDVDEIQMLSEGDVEQLITEVNSWRSDIDNPLEWNFSTITLQTGSSNSMVLRESNPNESFGVIESNPLEFDFSFDIEAKLGATIIPPGASVTISLLDEKTGETIQLLTAEEEGTFTGRVADVADWSGSRTVRVQIWVTGEDTPVSLDYVELYPLSVAVSDPVPNFASETEPSDTDEDLEDSADTTEDELTEEPIVEEEAELIEDDASQENEATEETETSATESTPPGPELPTISTLTIWEERFGPMERIWLPSGVRIETTSAGGLRITENAPDQGFGRIEGETVSINLLEHPILRLQVLEVAPGTGFTIQIQEQGNAYDFFDAIQTDQPGEYEINLVDLTGWNDDILYDFRVLIWVSGEGGSIVIDNLTIGR